MTQQGATVERRQYRPPTLYMMVGLPGPLGYEMADLSIATGDDIAYCHSLNRVSGTKVGGGQLVMWWRATVCWRRVGGTWRVTHEHSSVPFDPHSGMAALDLEP